jgi:hypothetical protein
MVTRSDIGFPDPSWSDVSNDTHKTQDFKTAPPPYQAAPRTSLDITQRIEQKLARYNASQNVFKRWLFEILSVTTSAVYMGECSWLSLLHRLIL